MAAKKNAFRCRPIDGVLLLDKPAGITSNTALQRMKRLLCAAKAGHIGTLDPLASGLLPLCFGEATKFSSSAFLADKVYLADIQLGVTTTTADAEGDIVARLPVHLDLVKIKETLQKFVGAITQTPPMYSALKRNGKPLYAYARAGETVVVEPRIVNIYDLQLINYCLEQERLHIRVHCGSGTYIRTLAEDIGRALGCGAMLAALRRVIVGAFDITAAIGFETIEETAVEHRTNLLLSVDCLVAALPVCLLGASEVRRVITGRTGQTQVDKPGRVRLYDEENRFLGVGEVLAGGLVIPHRLLAACGHP